MDISKIRDERLTEDEKMEIIADYLENSGGSGKLKVKVNVDYVPTAAAEIRDISDEFGLADGTVHAYSAMTGVSFEDEKGNAIDNATVKTAIIDGNIEIIGMDHLGDAASIDGASVTLADAISFSSFPVSTFSNANGSAATAIGLTFFGDCAFLCNVIFMNAGGTDMVGAMVGVSIAP